MAWQDQLEEALRDVIYDQQLSMSVAYGHTLAVMDMPPPPVYGPTLHTPAAAVLPITPPATAGAGGKGPTQHVSTLTPQLSRVESLWLGGLAYLRGPAWPAKMHGETGNQETCYRAARSEVQKEECVTAAAIYNRARAQALQDANDAARLAVAAVVDKSISTVMRLAAMDRQGPCVWCNRKPAVFFEPSPATASQLATTVRTRFNEM